VTLWVLNAGMWLSPASDMQSPTIEQPRFQIEIQPAGDRGPRYTVTNLTGKTVTACVIELSSSSRATEKWKTIWDALLQDQLPIEPGASISQYLLHEEGGPLPDKVDVLAGVWTDGETFGQSFWVKNIVETRALRASEYELTATILRQGLEQDWSRDRYLQAIGDEPDSKPIYAIRSTLLVNQQFTAKRPLRRAMQMLLESFVRKSSQLRNAKPSDSSTIPG
jgi:hypothetical protein